MLIELGMGGGGGLVWLYCSLGKTVEDFAGANTEIGHFVLWLVFQLVSHHDRSDTDVLTSWVRWISISQAD